MISLCNNCQYLMNWRNRQKKIQCQRGHDYCSIDPNEPVKHCSDYTTQFYKTLNEDVKLISDEYGDWDIAWDNTTNDWINCTGFDSLVNACIIAIMTRWTEEDFLPPYEDFGCRVHELIKKNKGGQVVYSMEIFVTETLNNMRRVKTVNWVNITDTPEFDSYNYRIDFNITPMSDADVEESKIEALTGGLYI